MVSWRAMPRRESQRASAIEPSPIRTMTTECARVGGINLAQGVCDTPVPPQVRRAAAAAIEAGENVYSRYDGREELRRALADKMRRDNGVEYDPETEVIVTVGATGAFYIAALGLLEAGDEVILFEPYYGYHRSTLVSLDVKPVTVALSFPLFTSIATSASVESMTSDPPEGKGTWRRLIRSISASIPYL